MQGAFGAEQAGLVGKGLGNLRVGNSTSYPWKKPAFLSINW